MTKKRASVLGKYVHTVGNGQHPYAGHHGWVIKEDIEGNEYTVAGGSISVLGASNGSEPVLCRHDFKVPRKQPDNAEVLPYLVKD